jgi:hypothetical protein
MKPGIILGLATAVPAFLVLLIPVGEPTSAFAALITGAVIAVVCELSSPTRLKLTWARGAALVVWWVIVGILVGITEAMAAAMVQPPGLGAGIIGLVGSWVLGIWGAIVGYVVGRLESKGPLWQFSLRTLLIVMTVIAVLLGMAKFNYS